MTHQDKIACVCHAVNQAYCDAIGDPTQQDWIDAPEWQKESARIGVQNVITNGGSTPEESHASWLDTKKKDGWVWGYTKDANLTCMVPYDQLPDAQKLKDSLFILVVNELIDKKGFRLNGLTLMRIALKVIRVIGLRRGKDFVKVFRDVIKRLPADVVLSNA